MVYTCLHAMRAGLLTRFWGSLGMALGAVSFIFFQFALLWFVYLGLLLLGRVPGGRPPAWAVGRSRCPGRRPGEKAAAELEGPAAELGATPAELESGRDPSRAPIPATPASRRKKRKQRD